MSVSLQFFGAAGYSLKTSKNVHVVMDPFMDENPFCPVSSDDLEKVDLLLLTHNAFDHLGDAAKIIKKHKCKVICALDVLHNLTAYQGVDPDLIRVTIWGFRMEECGVPVAAVQSVHWSFARTPDGQFLSGPAVGFIVDAGDGVVIYHPGDTALFSDMKLIGEIYKPTAGLMHISLPMEPGVGLPHPECYKTGEITPGEGLLAAEWMGLKDVVASHYVDPECDDVKEFLRLVEERKKNGGYAPNTIVLKPGETHTWG